MKGRLIASAAVLAVVLTVLLVRGPGPGASARLPEPAARKPPAVTLAPVPDPGMPWPARNPFRYADERDGGASQAPPRTAAAPAIIPAPLPAASASPLRLIGLVRKGGALKAALSVWGETVVLREGEESRGYKVLSIDEETGVRLRGPDGAQFTLGPSSF